jgi:alkanesulfonate monooxygenase SsuD/methylene tetrahydromethanopterin reductase-like flavin-dependent oxidoreductase (luciferase family)
MSALASETEWIRLGTLATCVSFRYPSLLAKMASTFDVISGGRLELGIGAGWYEFEYKAYGIPYHKPSTRIKQLEEAVQILKLMWTKEEATFHGKYYHIEDAVCSPKPTQKPHPPIWICGGGEKLTLKVVAKYADGCNFFDCTSKEYKKKLHVLKEHCEKIGRNPVDIKASFLCKVIIADKLQEARKKALEFQVTERPARETCFKDFILRNIFGSPDNCIKSIQRYIDAGVKYFMLDFYDPTELKQLQLFAKQVIPSFK